MAATTARCRHPLRQRPSSAPRPGQAWRLRSPARCATVRRQATLRNRPRRCPRVGGRDQEFTRVPRRADRGVDVVRGERHLEAGACTPRAAIRSATVPAISVARVGREGRRTAAASCHAAWALIARSRSARRCPASSSEHSKPAHRDARQYSWRDAVACGLNQTRRASLRAWRGPGQVRSSAFQLTGNLVQLDRGGVERASTSPNCGLRGFALQDGLQLARVAARASSPPRPSSA